LDPLTGSQQLAAAGGFSAALLGGGVGLTALLAVLVLRLVGLPAFAGLGLTALLNQMVAILNHVRATQFLVSVLCHKKTPFAASLIRSAFCGGDDLRPVPTGIRIAS
jgi:uncharacterized membrane protein